MLVFVAAIGAGVGAVYADGWAFLALVCAAWLWMAAEVSIAASRALGLPPRRYLWLDVFFLVGAVSMLRIFFESAAAAPGLGIFVVGWFSASMIFFPGTRAGVTRWLFSSVIQPYMAVGVGSFMALRESGRFWPMVGIVAVVAADTGAYLIGRKFGRRQLAPAVSPAKTLEGAIGGFVLTVVAVSGMLVRRGEGMSFSAGVGAALGLAAIFGDLFESFLKRGLGIKDFGASLPGHGGIFDRLDSLLAVSITLVVVLLVQSAIHPSAQSHLVF